jgi:hypothetical protein
MLALRGVASKGEGILLVFARVCLLVGIGCLWTASYSRKVPRVSTRLIEEYKEEQELYNTQRTASQN